MSSDWFITATDTGVGKTRVAQALMQTLIDKGLRVAGMKPVASGCAETPDGLRSADALALIETMNVDPPYAAVNPYAFVPAIAPHVAAQQSGTSILLAPIEQAYRRLRSLSDIVVIEGVGGWRVPLGPGLTLTQLVQRLDLAVILVVGLKLGCLNHARLTAEAIKRDGVECRGWIANHLSPEMPAAEENIAALRELLPMPHLATLAYRADPGASRFAYVSTAGLGLADDGEYPTAAVGKPINN